MHSTLLAFDIGTSGLKASLVDENLNIIRNVTTSYPTHHYPNGGCEQEAADWWMSAVRAMMMLRELAPEYVKRVDAIGVSGHMLGCLPMDKDGQTLRPAMIHADTRALAISNALRARFGRDYFYEICGNVLSPASTLCKTLWLKENEPALRPYIPHPAVEGLSCLPPHGPHGDDRYVRRVPRAAHESGNAAVRYGDVP